MLSVQRDHYLPLKVIREHLEPMDRGQPPPAACGCAPAGATRRRPVGSGGASPSGDARPRARRSHRRRRPAARQPLRLTRQELLEASGLTEAALVELERTQIVRAPSGAARHYGREALTLAIAARRLAEYGMDGRHLRAFKMSADREVGLVEQAIAPYVRRAARAR